MIIKGKDLKSAIKFLELTQETAAKKIGIARQTLVNWLNSGELNPDVVQKVQLKLQFDLSDYVEKMSSGKNNPRLEAIPLHLASDPNDFDNDGSKFEHNPEGLIRMRVQVVPQKAYAGYLRGFQDPEFYENLKTVSIDVEKEYRGHYLAFEVSGDSMITTDPDLFKYLALPGWIAIGRELPHHHWKDKLHYNRINHWVIVHDTEGILIKQIIHHDIDLGKITIHSLNPKYSDEVLSLNDIAQIFAVHKFIVEP